MVPQQKLSWQESARKVQAVRDRSIEHVDPAIAALPDTHTGRVIDFPRKHLSQTEIAIMVSISKISRRVDLSLMSWFHGRWLLKLAAISLESPPTHIIPLSRQVVLLVENQPCKPSMAALWELALISVC